MLKRGDKNILKARMVWEDASDAFRELRQAIRRHDRALFRRRWVAAITLLRAIGNVLYAADSELHVGIAPVIDKFLEESRNDPIYEHFIRAARNMTVKEYRSGLFGRWDTASPMSIEPVREGEKSETDLVFREGYYAGRSMEQLFREALDWWDQHLTKIEQNIIQAE